MYELLILGILASRDMAGYKLSRVLGSALIPRREISNGVMYPLLKKLTDAGYIEMIPKADDPRHKKVAHLLPPGKDRLLELMRQPVEPEDARFEMIYQFKFRSMAAVDSDQQLQILQEFAEATETSLNVYHEIKKHMKEKNAKYPKRQKNLVWVMYSMDLNIAICQTKITWIKERQAEIEEQKMNEKTTVKQWIALGAMGLGVFMGLLDVTVVNVALPTMVRNFNTTFTDLQWVLNAYTLVYAVSLMIMSKLGDMYGRKRIFTFSLILFVIASAVNGMATNLLVLDIGRGVQAIGGSGMMSLSMALIASNFQGRARGLALGIQGSIIGLSTASGPLIGGFLVEQFGWASIFYVNIPFGIIALILTIIYVKETPSYGRNQKLDLVGMVLSAAGLFAVIFGLITKEGHSHWTWTDPRISGWIAGGVILLIAFIYAETKIKDPMVNLKIFKSKNFVGVVIVGFALGSGVYAYNAFLTALMQNYIGYTAVQTGVRQLVMSVWSLVLGPVVGIVSARYSRKWMIAISLFIGGAGFLLIANVLGPTVGFVSLWPGMVCIGITNAIVNPLLNTAGMEGVKPQEMGMASGLINVFRQLGTTVGVVSLGLIQTSSYEKYLNGHMGAITGMPTAMVAGIHKALVDAGPFSGHAIAYSKRLSTTPFAHNIQTIVWHAYSNGTAALSITAAGIVIIGGICAAWLLAKNPHSTHLRDEDFKDEQR